MQAPHESQQPQRFDWFLLTLAYACLFIYGLADNSRGPVFPDILKDFALSDRMGSLFFFVASTVALINNVLGFRLIEAKGSLWTLRAYALVQAAGLFVISYAPSYYGVLAGCALFGASMGSLGIVVNLLAAQAAPAAFRRRALSGLHAMYGIASLLAPLFVTSVYEAGGQWRGAIGILAFVPLLLWAATFAQKRKHDPTESALQRGESLRHRPTRLALLFALTASAYVIAELSIGTRLALYARRDLGLPLETANGLLSAYFVSLFAGRLAFTVAHIKLEAKAVLALSALSSILLFALGLTVSPWFLAATGFSLSMFYPCMIAWIHDLLPREEASFVTNSCITLQSLSLMMMHFALGAASDAFGLARALWMGPLALVAVLFLLWKIGSEGRLKRPKQDLFP